MVAAPPVGFNLTFVCPDGQVRLVRISIIFYCLHSNFKTNAFDKSEFFETFAIDKCPLIRISKLLLSINVCLHSNFKIQFKYSHFIDNQFWSGVQFWLVCLPLLDDDVPGKSVLSSSCLIFTSLSSGWRLLWWALRLGWLLLRLA